MSGRFNCIWLWNVYKSSWEPQIGQFQNFESDANGKEERCNDGRYKYEEIIVLLRFPNGLPPMQTFPNHNLRFMLNEEKDTRLLDMGWRLTVLIGPGRWQGLF